MTRICTTGAFSLAAAALLAAGCAAPPPAEGTARLTVLPTAGLLTPLADVHGAKLFDPITPYTLARHPPRVDYAAYAEPYGADWTHWGTGCLHSNGRVYTVLGDHRGTNADCFLYEFDPSAGTLRLVGGLQEAVEGFKRGDYGFSKVHGRIWEGSDGKLYFSTWWGPDSDSPRYVGERIFSYDPCTDKLTDLGVTIPGYGTPATGLDPRRLTFYGEFIRPPNEDDAEFVAYDLRARRVLFRGGHENDSKAGRAIVVDPAGCAYYACAGTVRKYDPATNTVTDLPDRLPANHKKLRQHASRPRPDGTIYATTKTGSHSRLIAVDGSAGRITELATLWGEIKAIDTDSSGRWVYYVADCRVGTQPDEEELEQLAKMDHPVTGLPIVQVDMAHGASQKVIAFLEVPLRRALGWEPRGKFTCFSLLASADGRTLYITLNGRRRCDLGFYHSTPLFLVVHIPPQEIGK
jgi:hypothetical protein